MKTQFHHALRRSFIALSGRKIIVIRSRVASRPGSCFLPSVRSRQWPPSPHRLHPQPQPRPTAWAKRHTRRMAGMAPPAARLLARAAISRQLVWARPMGRPVEFVGRRMVLGSGAARHRRLLPAAEPWPDQLDFRRRFVAVTVDPARRLAAGSPRPSLVVAGVRALRPRLRIAGG